MFRYSVDKEQFRRNITSQYHTHPSGSGPSRVDATRSTQWNIPVHTVSPNGDVWRVLYPKGTVVPIFYVPYGKLINN